MNRVHRRHREQHARRGQNIRFLDGCSLEAQSSYVRRNQVITSCPENPKCTSTGSSGDVPGFKRHCHDKCFNILKLRKGSGTTALVSRRPTRPL
ncbi:hypothetical protein MTO96_003013 [Rhipicephalus appendiculatus]